VRQPPELVAVQSVLCRYWAMMPYTRFRRHAKNADFIREFNPHAAVATTGLKRFSRVAGQINNEKAT